jgi:predicted dehydrogenase
MAAEPLSVAVLGLGPSGRLLLDAAQTSGRFCIRAVADTDRQRAEQAATLYHCDAYTDYRQLIVQNQLDALLVAADIHTCDEYVKAAVRKKFHVLKLTPPARTFAEAFELTELAQSENVCFVIANPLRYTSAFQIARVWITEGRVSQPFLITAQVRGPAVDRATWQSDPMLAGGGVLLHDGYGIIDQILRNFPLPQQVYALNRSQAPDKQQRLCLTEDTAVVSLEFTDALVGSLVALRGAGAAPEPACLTLHGKDRLLTVSRDCVHLANLRDGTEQVQHFQEDERDIMVRLLDDFAHHLRSPGEPTEVSTMAENLKNMAVLESAYLSARTGAPEEPERVLQQTRNYLPIIATKV